MSELLTHEEYKAIADGLTLASTAFVDGGFRKAASGVTFDSIDPATGKLLAKVAACVGRSPNFCAIKESSGDINRLHMLARDYPHIQTSCGMDDQALEFFAWGAESWICAGSNFAPEAHIALWKTCVVDGDYTLGRKIMSAMLPLMRTLEQGGKFLQCIKYGCAIRGLPAGPPRAPLRDLNKDEKRSLEQVIRVMDRTVDELMAGAGKGGK